MGLTLGLFCLNGTTRPTRQLNPPRPQSARSLSNGHEPVPNLADFQICCLECLSLLMWYETFAGSLGIAVGSLVMVWCMKTFGKKKSTAITETEARKKEDATTETSEESDQIDLPQPDDKTSLIDDFIFCHLGKVQRQRKRSSI